MKDFPVALQLYTVRDDMKADFAGTLKKVRAFGYDGVEFAGLFGHTAGEVKAMCADAGLVPISAHVPYNDLAADPGILDIYAEIGCKYVAIPHIGEEFRVGHPRFAEMVEVTTKLGEKARSLGMWLCYHNHDFEFETVDGEYALDILFKEIPATVLQTEIDTCWVKVGGEDPAAYLRKYAGRADMVHLKDFSGSKTQNMYALIGVDDNEEKDTGGRFEFRPVGYGVQDFPSILEAAKDVGAKWVVVEQDKPSLDKTPLESAEMSIRYLNSL